MLSTMLKWIMKNFIISKEGISHNPAEYAKLGYDKKIPVPGVIEYTKKIDTINSGNEKKGADKKSEIENMMRSYVEGLDKDGKARFRHEMLDLIYKITE